MKFLDHLEEWFITFLMGGATLIVFLAVLHRYGAGFAIPGVQDWLLSINMTWAQELTIIMFVWMAKFGAAYGVRTGIHVGVDVLINRLSDANRGKFIIFGLAAGAVFTAIVAYLGSHFVWENGAHYGLYKLFGLAAMVELGGAHRIAAGDAADHDRTRGAAGTGNGAIDSAEKRE